MFRLSLLVAVVACGCCSGNCDNQEMPKETERPKQVRFKTDGPWTEIDMPANSEGVIHFNNDGSVKSVEKLPAEK